MQLPLAPHCHFRSVETRTWTKITPDASTSTLPPPRFRHTATFVPATREMLVFGGSSGAETLTHEEGDCRSAESDEGEFLNDFYAFNVGKFKLFITSTFVEKF